MPAYQANTPPLLSAATRVHRHMRTRAQHRKAMDRERQMRQMPHAMRKRKRVCVDTCSRVCVRVCACVRVRVRVRVKEVVVEESGRACRVLTCGGRQLIDDNPAECAHVHAELPEVHVCVLPARAEACMRTLEFGAWPLVLRQTGKTAEDARRTQLYQQDLDRTDAMRAQAVGASSLADVLRSLEVEVEVRGMTAGEAGRVAQLTVRTTQFNGEGSTVVAPPASCYAPATRACRQSRAT